MIALNHISFATQWFGYQGTSGRDGYSGESGRDGNSYEVKAQGQSMTLDLSASAGRSGYDGERGGDANYCRQPNLSSEDQQGAWGGSGGRGGDGGKGGNAGDLRIFYEQVTNLKKISVYSFGGSGG